MIGFMGKIVNRMIVMSSIKKKISKIIKVVEEVLPLLDVSKLEEETFFL